VQISYRAGLGLSATAGSKWLNSALLSNNRAVVIGGAVS
jgi:hypothetical protein